MGEEECLKTWNNIRTDSSFPRDQITWMEWDPFLKASIIQSGMVSFVKLIDEHEH